MTRATWPVAALGALIALVGLAGTAVAKSTQGGNTCGPGKPVERLQGGQWVPYYVNCPGACVTPTGATCTQHSVDTILIGSIPYELKICACVGTGGAYAADTIVFEGDPYFVCDGAEIWSIPAGSAPAQVYCYGFCSPPNDMEHCLGGDKVTNGNQRTWDCACE